MKKIIAVINQKGGVGKSTTAGAIGAGLILKGYKILFVDLDAQGNLSYSFNAIRPPAEKKDTLNILTKETAPDQAIQHTPQGDIIASTPALAAADTFLTEVGKEHRLKEALEPLQQLYDFIIIDTPPHLGILTINALTACHEAVIPARADIYSLQGIGQLYGTIDTVKKYTNPDLAITGIVLTMHNKRTVIGRDIAEMLQEAATHLHTRLFNTCIRECIALQEAQRMKQSIFEYAPTSNAAKDYNDLLIEILKED